MRLYAQLFFLVSAELGSNVFFFRRVTNDAEAVIPSFVKEVGFTSIHNLTCRLRTAASVLSDFRPGSPGDGRVISES